MEPRRTLSEADYLLWLGAGASGWVDLPVMRNIIEAVGIGGAGLRLAFLGSAVGLVAGALGGIRPRVEVLEDEHELADARRIILEVDDDVGALEGSGRDLGGVAS